MKDCLTVSLPPLSKPDAVANTWSDHFSLDALAAWMDAKGLGSGPIEAATPLVGGTQNILLRFERNGRGYVLRRPPPSPYLDGGTTIRREMRVLNAIRDRDVPHPRLIATCVDREPLGTAFYLMEPVDGFVLTRGMPALHAHSAAVQTELGFAIIDALAVLQAIDPIGAGLSDFGKAEGFLQRQAARWMKQLDSYSKYPRWDGRKDLRGVDALAAWLDANLPRHYQTGIIHGDMHVGNLLFSRTSADLLAIVDWELATLGDPLIDLGCLLATWTDPDGSSPGCVTVEPWTGFPTEAELVDRYAARTGRDMTDYNWFVVLACFKLAVLQEGTYARAAEGLADVSIARWMHETSINLLERARGRI